MRHDAVRHRYPAMHVGPLRALWIAPRRWSDVSVNARWRSGEHSVHAAIGPLYVELRLAPKSTSGTVTH